MDLGDDQFLGFGSYRSIRNLRRDFPVASDLERIMAELHARPVTCQLELIWEQAGQSQRPATARGPASADASVIYFW